jgi:predicted MFS family arabinose efflux permease
MTAAEVTTPPDQRGAFRRLAPFFAAIYFVQGIAEPGAGIGSQPLFYLLKERLGLGPADTATFMAIVGVAWTVKPLYGLTSDFFPLFGYRRRSYLLCTTALAAAAWFFLGIQPAHAYGLTLLVLVFCGLGLAFSDVLCDAVMVETGKPLGMTGRFQSVQWGAINAASVLAGIGGGWLSRDVSPQHTFLLISVFPALSFITTAVTLREPRARFDKEVLRSTARAIWSAVGSRPLWLAAGFIFLWNFSPSFGVPLNYYMVDTLRFSKMSLGTLGSLGAGASIVGAFLFGRYFRRLPIRPLLNVSVAIGVVTTLAYWGLVGWWSAVVLTLATGASGMVAVLATLDLAARSCPDRAEGTFFAALMSINNLAGIGSAYVGGKLFESVGLQKLILISAAATALCWLLVPFVRLPEAAAREGMPPRAEDPIVVSP